MLDKIRQAENLTESEQALATYILENADTIAASSISELAQASFTSNATVIRLCNKLGVSGYRELRVLIAAELAGASNQASDIDPNHPFQPGADIDDVVDGIESVSREAISACARTISREPLTHAAELIRESENIYLYSVGDSEISCEAFANQLMKVGTRCIIAGRHCEYIVNARSSTPDDVAVVVSYSGYMLDGHKEAFETLQNRGCKLVAITSRPDLMGDYDFDCVLELPGEEDRAEKVGSFYSQACIRFALNCLYGAVFSYDFEANELLRNRVDG